LHHEGHEEFTTKNTKSAKLEEHEGFHHEEHEVLKNTKKNTNFNLETSWPSFFVLFVPFVVKNLRALRGCAALAGGCLAGTQLTCHSYQRPRLADQHLARRRT